MMHTKNMDIYCKKRLNYAFFIILPMSFSKTEKYILIIYFNMFHFITYIFK